MDSLENTVKEDWLTQNDASFHLGIPLSISIIKTGIQNQVDSTLGVGFILSMKVV